jgi:threonine dehydratase
MDLSVEHIKEAAQVIDPVFRDSPQFVDDQLSARLGRRVLVKVETLNPLRSFKGRGALFLAHRLDAGLALVCSSTGNFGQAITYAARTRSMVAHVFVPQDVNPAKLATVITGGNIRPDLFAQLCSAPSPAVPIRRATGAIPARDTT